MKNKNPFRDNKRYNSISDYFRINFGGRVQKLAIDAGFTCPNRDGSKGTGGCTFCNNDAFNPSYCSSEKPVYQQITEGIEFHRTRYSRAIGYLAYFQAYSNTYAPLEKLKGLYSEALSHPGILGLAIGTRPDCMDERILDYLAELSRKTYVVVEYGIETCHNKTLERINRGHDFETTAEMIRESDFRNIRTGGHLIIGLPGETKEEIAESVRSVSNLPLKSLKLHQLQIIKDTRLADDYKQNPSDNMLYKLDEYLDFVTELTGILNPAIVIERIAAETPPAFNLFPAWDLRYDQVLIEFEKLLEKKDLWQGKYYRP